MEGCGGDYNAREIVPQSWVLPMVRKPAPLQARVVSSQPFCAAINAGQAWLVGSPKPFMIESPIVSTCGAAITACGATGSVGVAVVGVAVVGVTVGVGWVVAVEDFNAEAKAALLDCSAYAVVAATWVIRMPPTAPTVTIAATTIIRICKRRVGDPFVDLLDPARGIEGSSPK